MNMKNNRLGMCYGLAIGDALGACVEFKGRDTYAPVSGYRTGTHNLVPGMFTDDTSMAIGLGYSLQKGFDLADQLDHYCRWKNGDKAYHSYGRFDIGGQTSGSLSHWVRTRTIQADKGGNGCGNGSIMRLSPVVARYQPGENLLTDIEAFLASPELQAVSDLCALSSITTHPANTCVTACRALGVLLALLASGFGSIPEGSEDFPLDGTLLGPGPCPLVVKMLANKTWTWKKRHEISSSGYVLHTLEAALWAFRTTDSFEACVLAAANLGSDSDSVAAVAGQLAGAWYGLDGIPQHLMDGLQDRNLLDAAFLGLVK